MKKIAVILVMLMVGAAFAAPLSKENREILEQTISHQDASFDATGYEAVIIVCNKLYKVAKENNDFAKYKNEAKLLKVVEKKLEIAKAVDAQYKECRANLNEIANRMLENNDDSESEAFGAAVVAINASGKNWNKSVSELRAAWEEFKEARQ